MEEEAPDLQTAPPFSREHALWTALGLLGVPGYQGAPRGLPALAELAGALQGCADMLVHGITGQDALDDAAGAYLRTVQGTLATGRAADRKILHVVASRAQQAERHLLLLRPAHPGLEGAVTGVQEVQRTVQRCAAALDPGGDVSGGR